MVSIIGYFKLDYLIRYKSPTKRDAIVIAPTNFLSFKKLSLYSKLIHIIDVLLKHSKLKIIFRPHPSNLNFKEIDRICKKYKKNDQFILDKSIDYSKVYNKSICLITDVSGTAYTYAFFTKQPVIFFRNYKKSLENKYSHLNYFKDRKKIGFIFDKVSKFKQINRAFIKKKTYKNNINSIIKQNFDIGKTKKNFFNELEKI